MQPQDKIFVTGNRIEVVLFHNNVRPQVIKSMMIIGAGKIAYYLLNILQDVRRKIDLKVLEVNRERAEFFSQEFPDLYVVHGDGTAKDKKSLFPGLPLVSLR